MNNSFEDQPISVEELDSLVGKEFINCIFEKQNLQNQKLNDSKFIECEFIECNLSNASVLGSRFSDVKFSNSKLIGINWTQASLLLDVEFLESVLDFGVFQALKLERIKMISCEAKEVDFSECLLQNSDFSKTNLLGTSFNGADLSKADLRGAANYFIDPQFTKIKKAKLSLPEAIEILKALDIILD